MPDEQRGQSDRKGKGKAKDQNQDQDQNQRADESEDRQKQGEGEDQRNDRDGGQQQMKEIRRPPPLPAVKGTIGAIESPSRRSFFSGSPTSTVRGNHSRGPSYDTNYRREPESPSPHSQQQQPQQEDFRTRDRPVFRSDPTLTSCFDRLRLAKKEEIRALFNA